MDDNQPLGREGQEDGVSGAAVRSRSQAPQELNMEECERASEPRSLLFLSILSPQLEGTADNRRREPREGRRPPRRAPRE